MSSLIHCFSIVVNTSRSRYCCQYRPGLVTADHGVKLIRKSNQRIVLYLNRAGGQLYFSECLHTDHAPKNRFEQVLTELVADPSGNLRNLALTEKLVIIERHLGRLYRDRPVPPPARWVKEFVSTNFVRYWKTTVCR